jgi:DNA-binding HxlR family transcriptional regulator/peroxiredoxin
VAATTWRGADPSCAIAQAAVVVGDRWSLVILRDVARGLTRFDELVTELAISRKVLAERLAHLEDHGILTRVPYQDRPLRHDYVLTPAGRALLPALVALQDWGDRWVLGDGAASATTDDGTADQVRVASLVGTRVPAPLVVPSTTGGPIDVVDVSARATVLFAYPATSVPAPLPRDWSDIPGAAGCTLENRLFREAWPRFAAAGVSVHGLSTQRTDEQRVFADAERIAFPLLSDADLTVAAALRLPTLRTASTLRLRRLVLVIDPDRTITAVRYPVTDIAEAVEWSLEAASAR